MTNLAVPLDFNLLADQLSASTNHRVLTRFDPRTLYRLEEVPADAGFGIVLDTETTGKDPKSDRIVELGLVPFAFDRQTRRVLSAFPGISQLQDPGMPIPPDATRVNGITDEMVQGKAIDAEAVNMLACSAEVVIAHNAQFDREFCEAAWPVFRDKAWACSLHQMDWAAAGISSAKLEFIAYKLSFFYEAHRAEMDCLALLHALDLPLAEADGRTALDHILGVYKTEERRIWAVNSPFDAKDRLKERGYRWSDGTDPTREKAWFKVVPVAEYEDELAWLREAVYAGKRFTLPVDRVDALNRFSSRREATERVYL